LRFSSTQYTIRNIAFVIVSQRWQKVVSLKTLAKYNGRKNSTLFSPTPQTWVPKFNKTYMFVDQLVYIWIGCEIFMTYMFGDQLMYIWTDGEIEIFMTYMFGDQLVYIWNWNFYDLHVWWSISVYLKWRWNFHDLHIWWSIRVYNFHNDNEWLQFWPKKYTFNILLLNIQYSISINSRYSYDNWWKIREALPRNFDAN
jgi:hypothetical protein